MVNVKSIAIPDFFKNLLGKLKKLTTENWGFPFVSAFIILLVVAAVLLATGSPDLANDADIIAIFAFFSLVIGAFLQIICFSRSRKNSGALSNPQNNQKQDCKAL